MLSKPKLLYFCTNIIVCLTLLLAIVFSSCSPSEPPVPHEKSKAYFDYFTYSGNDDFYNNNPLTNEDEYYNPILPGWYSDPSICTNGDDYFLVTSTFVNFPGVPIFHSKDLVNWNQIGHVLDRESQLVNMTGQHTSGGIFAPAISYNPQNETYYMVTTNVGAGNFFVKTKDPFGQWSDPILLPEVGGIDPSFFFDEDGKAYIVNNDEPEGEPEYSGHRAIRIREFDVETEQTVGESKVLVDKGVRPEEKPIWIEGPHLYKINGKYYLMSAEGGTGPGHCEVILRSDSPMGPYKAWDKNPILTQRHLDHNRVNPITCAGHADIIQTKEGDWWGVFLACRPIEGKFENLGRETFLMPVKWSEDGFPYFTQGNDLIPMAGKKEGVVRSDSVTFGNHEKTYEFDAKTLDYDWMTMRTAASDLYSLSDNPGYLSLKCGTHPATSRNTPAYVCRRLQHHKFECSTKMYFNPEDHTEQAGLLLYKDEGHQYFLGVKKVDAGMAVYVERVGEENNVVLVSKFLKKQEKPIRLKVSSSGKKLNFYYAVDEAPWELLSENIDAYYLSTANSYGFTGTTIGMYAVKNELQEL